MLKHAHPCGLRSTQGILPAISIQTTLSHVYITMTMFDFYGVMGILLVIMCHVSMCA